MPVTFEVSSEDRSRDARLVQQKNIPLMSVALEVSRFAIPSMPMSERISQKRHRQLAGRTQSTTEACVTEPLPSALQDSPPHPLVSDMSTLSPTLVSARSLPSIVAVERVRPSLVTARYSAVVGVASVVPGSAVE